MITLIALALFAQYPNLSEYFETSDGQKFFKEDPAKVHARTLKNKSVKTVTRSEAEAEELDKTKTETAKDIFIKSADMDLETAQNYLDAENELEKPRVSVIGALEKRIAELETPSE